MIQKWRRGEFQRLGGGARLDGRSLRLIGNDYLPFRQTPHPQDADGRLKIR